MPPSKVLLCFSCLMLTMAMLLPGAHGNLDLNSTLQAVLQQFGQSYYNPMTGEPLTGILTDSGRYPNKMTKILFRGLPCACIEHSCGCCAGLNITAMNIDQRFCTNLTYDLANLTFDMKVLMNEREIYSIYSFSATNPPPICVPAPYVPIIDFCIRLRNISLPGGYNVQTCIDFETRLVHSPILVMSFNCMKIGTDGLAWVERNASLATVPPSALTTLLSAPVQLAGDVLDAVEFEPSDGFPVNSTNLTPEEEDQIGEHRFTGLLRALFG